MMERWKDIPEFEGLYQVSSEGRVRNVRAGYYGKILKTSSNKDSPGVKLRGYDRISHGFRVHTLMARTFFAGKNHIVRHKDGNQFNNALSNLKVSVEVPAKRK